ncbi:MAG: leucyl aminopeptidase family protein [Sandaracinaceae bacterium]|nr:leucyl aminopeptidase family protein [Sandaracinaceae bacterium]
MGRAPKQKPRAHADRSISDHPSDEGPQVARGESRARATPTADPSTGVRIVHAAISSRFEGVRGIPASPYRDHSKPRSRTRGWLLRARSRVFYERFAEGSGERVGACHARLWFTRRVLDSLVNRKSARTLPILPLDEADFAKWKRGKPKALKRWLEASGFEAKGNRVLLLPGERGPERALLGRSEESVWTWAAARQRLPAGRYRIEAELSPEAATEAAIGWGLASYRFDRYRSEPKPNAHELVWPEGADRAEVARQLNAIGKVRDFINVPAEDLGPAELAEAARAIEGAKVKVIRGKALTEGFPAVHAVGRGSDRAPCLVDLTWGSAGDPKLTIVGKGVTFDSGGLDLKSAPGMLRMKKDMGGAAIALGLASLVIDAALPVRLRVLVPAVENMPGPGAFRPGDVIRTRKGKSVEITNTDAEGRVILSDALTLAAEEAPDLLLDFATLTGAARVAVGTEITPFWTKDSDVAEALAKASRRTRDPLWRLPLHGGYRRHLDSEIADLKNSASTGQGGATIAALFLREFAQDAPTWVHFDTPAWNDRTRPGRPTGGEATSLRAVWELLKLRYPRGAESTAG